MQIEGTAQIVSLPEAMDGLVDYYRCISGEHPGWDDWRGRPLVSHEVIVALIGATRTRSGLRVRAALDRSRYPLGVVRDKELAAVPIQRHRWHGE
jgi:hypothetical protein